jgi:hypothetical protein
MALMQPTNVAVQSEEVTGATTLAEANVGIAQLVTVSATLTLPSTSVEASFTIVNGGQKSVTISLSPAAADKIIGNGFTSADNKDAVNTLGNYGDSFTVTGNGTTGWVVSKVQGTWTREA